MTDKEIVLNAIIVDVISFKKTKKQLMQIVLRNNGIPYSISEPIIFECARERLISLDEYGFVSIEDYGRNWLKEQKENHSKKLMNNYIESSIKVHCKEHNLIKSTFVNLWKFLNQNIVSSIIGGLFVAIVVILLTDYLNGGHLWKSIIHY